MSATSKPIRILAVDDHPIVRSGIAALVSTQPDMQIVGEASNGRDAIELFRSLRPDVTLMDVQMPAVDGIDALSAIRAEFANARVILLTTYSGDVQALRTQGRSPSLPVEESSAEKAAGNDPPRARRPQAHRPGCDCPTRVVSTTEADVEA